MASLLFHLLAARLSQDEEGQGLVEYGLIMILVAVVLVALLVVLGPGLGNIYSSIVNAI